MDTVRLNQYVELMRRWWQRRNPQTRALPGYLAQAFANYISYGTRQAAALAYCSAAGILDNPIVEYHNERETRNHGKTTHIHPRL